MSWEWECNELSSLFWKIWITDCRLQIIDKVRITRTICKLQVVLHISILITLVLAGDGTPILKKIIDRGERIDGVAFTRGDYAITVKQITRDEADPLRLTFNLEQSSEPTVMNSTELRAVQFTMAKSTMPNPPNNPSPMSTRSQRNQSSKMPKDGTYYLNAEDEKIILAACYWHNISLIE